MRTQHVFASTLGQSLGRILDCLHTTDKEWVQEENSWSCLKGRKKTRLTGACACTRPWVLWTCRFLSWILAKVIKDVISCIFIPCFCLFSLKYQLCCSTVLDTGKWQKLGILCLHWDQKSRSSPLRFSLSLCFSPSA